MTAQHYQNPYLPHTLRAPSPAPKKSKAAKITVDATGLPVGTAAQVLEWVGDDPDRAQRFLVKEQRETRPRVTLVSNLKAILKRHEILPEPPLQLAPQIDVIPAERALVEDVTVTDDPAINQLEIVRDRLKVE